MGGNIHTDINKCKWLGSSHPQNVSKPQWKQIFSSVCSNSSDWNLSLPTMFLVLPAKRCQMLTPSQANQIRSNTQGVQTRHAKTRSLFWLNLVLVWPISFSLVLYNLAQDWTDISSIYGFATWLIPLRN